MKISFFWSNRSISWSLLVVFFVFSSYNNVEAIGVNGLLSKRCIISLQNDYRISDTLIPQQIMLERTVDYSFYKEKFDINNPTHLRMMNEPTNYELNSFAAKLEAAGEDKILIEALDKLYVQANEIYKNGMSSQNKSEKEFYLLKSKLFQIMRTWNMFSAYSFDAINGFAGGPIWTCLSSHPAVKLNKKIFLMIHELKAKMMWVSAKSRNEPTGTLSANIQSMYSSSNFVTSVNTVMNGDPDMPQDLTANQVRFETVASSVPSWMTDPSNPIQNIVDLREELETNGMWWGVNADVFHFVAKSNILWTGISVNEYGVIGGCALDIPNVWVHVWSATNLPIPQAIAHELNHGIGEYNHTNTQQDIDNNEIQRPAVNVSSNYWNQTFTIIPFWEKVNQSDDCLNASSGLSSNFSILQISLSKCHTCPIGSKVNIQFAVNEVDNDYFVVERSEDGKKFVPIGRIESKGVGEHQYLFEDLSISKSGTYYYAIKDVSNAGVTGKPSDVKAISIDGDLFSNQVLLLNNPCFSNGSFSISNLSLGDVVSIYGLDGKLLRQFILDDASAFFHNKVDFPAPQFPGLFVLTVSRLDYSISFKLAVF